MSRPRHYSQAAQAKRMTPDMLDDSEDDEQFEWYDEETEPDAEQEAP